MAALTRDGSDIVLRLGPWEKLWALLGDVRVPASAVQSVEVVRGPFSAVRGIRAPGTGLPGVMALGTWRRRGAKDAVAVSRRHPGAVVVTLSGQPWSRLVVSAADPDAVRDGLAG